MPSCLHPGKKKKKKDKDEDEEEQQEEGGSRKADEVAHPHEHVSIITVFWFTGTARPPGDAAIGHICGVLRRRVVQHSCGATHNQSDRQWCRGSSVCMHKCCFCFCLPWSGTGTVADNL